MKKKYLRTARERLLWIPVFMVIVSAINTGIFVFLCQAFPEYTLKYLTSYNHRIFGLYAQYFLTAISVGVYLSLQMYGKKILREGRNFHGTIEQVLWKRAFFSGCEWKCRLVIRVDENRTVLSPYYKYDLLNYLAGTGCQVAVLENKCYVTEFQTIDRKMPKDERKRGLDGGTFWESRNETPEFPILDKVKVVNQFRAKRYREVSQRYGLYLICTIYVLTALQIGLRMFEPLHADSDGDGMRDSDEFTFGTDPTVFDPTFVFVKTDEMNGVRLEYRVEVPAPCSAMVQSDLGAAFIKKTVSRVESMPGYLVHPFVLRNPLGNSKSTVALEFDPALLQNENFIPQLYRCNNQRQEMIMIPCDWDGKSNVISAQFSDVWDPDREWEYYLLEKNAWEAWVRERDEIIENPQ